MNATTKSNDVFASTQTNIELYGLPISNITLSEATRWVLNCQSKVVGKTNVAYFVNAHSINMCFRKPSLHSTLSCADKLFADGIGMRLASHKAGTPLIDNVNGTDMLPLLCKEAAIQKKSIFFFGAKPGVAKTAAKNLQKQYPGLKVAGAQDGFSCRNNYESVIKKINASGADIVLVALGTPYQEAWIEKYASELSCSCILAVGGLFDFFSGNIPRAPQWMRKLGLEWVFRLIQEPKVKFTRYVVGVPEFLVRMMVSEKMLKEAKS